MILLVLLLLGQHGAAVEKPAPLALPNLHVPEMPALLPTVITSGGKRLLLNDTDVEVSYDAARNSLFVNRPDWWVINYPLKRIKGLESWSPDDIALRVFGEPARAARNWYIKTLGKPGPEPSPPTKPAAIDLTPHPHWIVNNRHSKANDANPGTPEEPLKTISAAIKRAYPGSVIHVYPGIYRESIKIEQDGAAEKPIRLEGIRDRNGRMPVVSGNDLFPLQAWKPVKGLPGVYRADILGKHLGAVSIDGVTFIERSLPQELKENEFCLNRASKEFLNLRVDGSMNAREGEEKDGRVWRRLKTDENGFLDLGRVFGREAANSVFWASTHVWIQPGANDGKLDSSRKITGRLVVDGEFRAARMIGSPQGAQVNKYRVWVNGDLLPSVIYSTAQDFQLRLPHPYRNYGFSDVWHGFQLNEGWNQLVFQFDTTTRPDKTRFKFGVPEIIKNAVSSATAPSSPDRLTEAPPRPYVAEYMVLGPFPAQKDVGVYVRLSGNTDPNTVPMDQATRGSELVTVHADFVHVRGFEIRHGTQFQQRAQVDLKGEGIVFEGNIVRDSEVGGISFTAQKNQKAAPIIIRNNWIVNPGNVGIGGVGSSEKLTSENQDHLAPGRGPVLVEQNTIINSNWAGFPPGWQAGGMKLFKLTGSVIRYNTVIGGSGPGIWLDWEHYGNRIEGNLLRSVFAYGIGVEASPGPNLVANNVSTNLRPGWEWFRAAILSWDSDRTWAVNNTIEGRNSTFGGANDDVIGINLGQGGNRLIRWGPLPKPQQVYANNLIVGPLTAMNPRAQDITAANLAIRDSEKKADAASGSETSEDYRLVPESALSKSGVTGFYTQPVTYDFYGLLRFSDMPRTIGAFRADPRPKAKTGTLIEVEFDNGRRDRLYDTLR